jgi:hypothetical protein
MKTIRLYLISAAILLFGLALGVALSRHFLLLEEFPRVIAERLVILDTWKALPANAQLQLLNIYEDDVRRQSTWLGTRRFNWRQELINIALQRYILHTVQQQTLLGEESLRRAAMLRKNTTPSAQDIDFEREIARRLYSRDDAPRQNR